MSDISPAMLEQAAIPQDIPYEKLIIDEEDVFPLEKSSLDIVISNLK